MTPVKPRQGDRRRPREKAQKKTHTPLTAAARHRRQSVRRPRQAKRSIGALFEALVALQARLRAANGCPWDREQTHASLRTYLVEEAYEVLEALESGDDVKLVGELGDLLLQIVFHAQLAREAGRFDVGDVIEHVHTKMVRRHPHVFGRVRAKTTAQVLKNWEQLKAEERREENGGVGDKDAATSLLEGVPHTLPAVLEAYQLTRRASRIGFDWNTIEGLLEKLVEETAELRQALEGQRPSSKKPADAAPVEEEIGDLLFVAVNVARFLGADPEIALKKANRKFIARFREMERQAARSGRHLADVSREELEGLWAAAKAKSPHTSLNDVARGSRPK